MLLNKAIERQTELAWTDQRMADELGIPRTTWSAAKTGRTGISLRMARAVVGRFPDLEPWMWADETKERHTESALASKVVAS